MLSISFLATILMAAYIGLAFYNLYGVMYPLTGVDLSKYSYKDDFVHPLWKTQEDMHMRVILSTNSRFSLSSLNTTASQKNNVVLWDERLNRPSLAKSFVLIKASSSSSLNINDTSHRYATQWLDRHDQADLAELLSGGGNVLSALSAASGQGIESTSFLLLLYESMMRQIRSVLETLSLVEPRMPIGSAREALGILDRATIPLPADSFLWKALSSNQTVYLHVLVLRGVDTWPPPSPDNAEVIAKAANKAHSLLIGKVNLLKYEPPHHIGKPKRILYYDIFYILRRYLLRMGNNASSIIPPWDMAVTKRQAYGEYQMAQRMKELGQGYPYWKPKVSIKFVSDVESYPSVYAHRSGMPVQKVGRSVQHPTGYAFLPALHVDEMGMTSDMYLPINETVTAVPLRISFDRSDMTPPPMIAALRSSTATAGGMSPARWRLLHQMAQAVEQQKQLGVDQSDIDEIKRLIADTNITLLTITMLASALHMLFEFLTFRNEVSFWNKNKDLTGLSVRSLFLDMIGQTILLLFLIEKDSSLLMTIPSAIGCLIALWKCQRAAGLKFVRVDPQRRNPSSSVARWMLGYELRALRLEVRSQEEKGGTNDDEPSAVSSRDRLIVMTMEADRLATRYLGAALLPLTVGYTVYSLIYLEHRGWYSWLITSLASAVYALGFVLMTPQLFLNWKLKSVAHLPWRVLGFKFVNTFIDDLFSFIIRMPTMARISCFRDDVVFFIYLYQRWLYPVDTSRPIEGGDGDDASSNKEKDIKGKKKID